VDKSALGRSVRGKINTVDVGTAVALADETFRRPQNIPYTNAQADVLDNFVSVFCIDIVLNRRMTGFAKIRRRNLHQVGDLGLTSGVRVASSDGEGYTRG